MKTCYKLFLTLSIIAVAVIGSSAQTPADVLRHGTSVTFFGVDFSRCKGVVLGANAEEMRDKYFPAINMLLVTEPQKYDVRKALKKSEVIIDLSDVNRCNQSLDVAAFDIYSANAVKPFDKETIEKMIQLYDLKDKTGTGLVFIAEVLDKPGITATYDLVYFSMPEGKIILYDRVTGTPKGFGMRNYWAYSIYDILKSGLQDRLELIYLSKNKN